MRQRFTLRRVLLLIAAALFLLAAFSVSPLGIANIPVGLCLVAVALAL